MKQIASTIRIQVLRRLAAPSMYRLVLLALGALLAYALLMSAMGVLTYSVVEIALAALALAFGAFAIDFVAHRLSGRALRWESTLITVLILLFVMRPSTSVIELAWLAAAGGVASASKFVLVWRKRHVFNPAAVAATVLTIATFSPAAWWVGTPVLAPVVAILGLAVAWRTEKIRVTLVFVVVAWAISIASTAAAFAGAGLDIAWGEIATQTLLSSPVLFLGLFMLTEPLTLPPRRGQQYLGAIVVAIFVGYPLSVFDVSLGADRALLIGNIVAFALAFRSRHMTSIALDTIRKLSPSITEVTLQAPASTTFVAGQYIELDVAHVGADQRGTRREFSIVSAPTDLPTLRVAYRTQQQGRASSFKAALGSTAHGDTIRATGIWGDFVLPARGPLLLVAAGIGITPFVSQVRQLAATQTERDIVVLYIASQSAELAYRSEFSAHRVIIVTPDDPTAGSNEAWAGGERMTQASLLAAIPDIASRHAMISGPPALIAELQPALRQAVSLTTDAFAGY